MSTVRVKKEPGRYAMIDTTGLNDPQLGWKAKGLLLYLLAKPNNWTARISQLARVSRDGRDAVASGLQELIECGYATRHQTRNTRGQFIGWDLVVYERPQDVSEDPKATETGFSVFGFPEHGKAGVNNIEFNNIEKTQDLRSMSANADADGKAEADDIPEDLEPGPVPDSPPEAPPSIPDPIVQHPATETSPTPERDLPLPKPDERPVDTPSVTRERPPRSRTTPTVEQATLTILDYLNGVSGHHFGQFSTAKPAQHIRARVREGATIEDGFLVIDWCVAVKEHEQPGFTEKYLNPKTPFDPVNFDLYLSRARAWDDAGRPDPRMGTLQTAQRPKTPEEQAWEEALRTSDYAKMRELAHAEREREATHH